MAPEDILDSKQWTVTLESVQLNYQKKDIVQLASELRDIYIKNIFFYINIGLLGRTEWLFKVTKKCVNISSKVIIWLIDVYYK